MRHSDEESGVATVMVIAALAVLFAIAVAGATMGVVLQARNHAGAAADMAALAASKESMKGGDGCDAAERVAQANGAQLKRCETVGQVATVTAQIPLRAWWGTTYAVKRIARAAPPSYDSEPTTIDNNETAPDLERG